MAKRRIRRVPDPERQLDRMETRRDPRAYIFYGALIAVILCIIVLTVIATVRNGR